MDLNSGVTRGVRWCGPHPFFGGAPRRGAQKSPVGGAKIVPGREAPGENTHMFVIEVFSWARSDQVGAQNDQVRAQNDQAGARSDQEGAQNLLGGGAK